jgi:predicted O-methyltransferase YrrM
VQAFAPAVRDLTREYALCLFFKQRRMSLPDLDLTMLFPDFDDQAATLTKLPKGAWSTPVTDVVVMAKLVKTLRPMRVVELGSYRGYTALAMAQNLPEHGYLLTVDIDPDHGEAYRDISPSSHIERRVGRIAHDLFEQQERRSFDVVFLDADHSLGAVREDTQVALDLVKPDGFVIWHDYANWGFFSGACAVPEALSELAARRVAIAHILGSYMAIHSPSWQGSGRATFDKAIAATHGEQTRPHWDTTAVRPAV